MQLKTSVNFINRKILRNNSSFQHVLLNRTKRAYACFIWSVTAAHGKREIVKPDLTRFLEAQETTYAAALAELKAGRKRSHWKWFVFPQIAGLGTSEMARRYLADPVLGTRLRESVAAVLDHKDRSAHAIFGSPDDIKFRSCLTLFELADPEEPLFEEALTGFYGGERDTKTIDLLKD
jgi:uncharacterized protein (DUF1810 family)